MCRSCNSAAKAEAATTRNVASEESAETAFQSIGRRFAAAYDYASLRSADLGARRFERRRLERLTGFAEHALAVFGVEQDVVADLERAAQQLFGERVFHHALDGTAQRTRSHRRIPSFFGQKFASRVGGLERHVLVLEFLHDFGEFESDDLLDLRQVELMEDHDFVDAIEELRPEEMLDLLEDLVLHPLVLHGRRTLVFDRPEPDLRGALHPG